MISSHSALHRTASSANTSGKQGFCVGTASAAEDRSGCRSSKRPTDLRGYDRRGNSYCTRRKPTSTPACRRRFCGPPTPACRESHGLPQAGTRASCRRTSGIRINPQWWMLWTSGLQHRPTRLQQGSTAALTWDPGTENPAGPCRTGVLTPAVDRQG